MQGWWKPTAFLIRTNALGSVLCTVTLWHVPFAVPRIADILPIMAQSYLVIHCKFMYYSANSSLPIRHPTL